MNINITGSNYNKVRSKLINDGWHLIEEPSSHVIDLKFPEISCGSGWNAICTAGFWKKDQSKNDIFISLKLKNIKDNWIIDAYY